MASQPNSPSGEASSPVLLARQRALSSLAAAVAATLLIGAAVWYLLATAPPTGRVAGRIFLKDTGRPLSDVDVYLTPSEPENPNPLMTEDAARPKAERDDRPRRHAHTDADGRFSLSHVAVGRYLASAVAESHQSVDVGLDVVEAKTATTELALERTQGDLEVATHPSVFGSSETPTLPVHGYVDRMPSSAAGSAQAAAPQRETLRVRVYRSRLSNLLRDPGAAGILSDSSNNDANGPLPLALLRPGQDAPAPRLLTDTTVPVAGADREGWFHQRIPLPVRGPGMYLVSVQHGKATVHSWLLCTDTALVVKRSPRQLVAYVANIKTGVPVPGATVRHLYRGRLLSTAVTGADGTAVLSPRPGDGPFSGTVTVASRGDDEAVVSRSNGYYVEEGERYVVHAYTDRTIYRPGDTISYKAIARRRSAAGDGYDVPRGVPVTVEIRDASNDRIAREEKVTDRHGTFHGIVTLSPEAPSGTYLIQTRIGGETLTDEIAVASYRKPEFSVTVTPVKKRYVRGETAEMTIAAKYYFGAPVPGATVHYMVYRDVDWSAEYADDDGDDSEDDEQSHEEFGIGPRGYYGSSVTEGDVTLGDDGTAVVRFPTDARRPSGDGGSGDEEDEQPDPADAPQAETFSLTASVTDEAKREVSAVSDVRVTAGDVLVTAEPEGYLAQPGRPAGISVKVRDPDGKPLAGVPVTLTANYWTWSDGDEQTGPALPTVRGTTGPDGGAVLSIQPPHAGDLRLTAQATDPAGRAVYTHTSLWVAGSEGGDLNTEYGDLSLHADKRRYQPGDTARVLVNASRTGQSVLLTVESDRVYAQYVVPVRQRSTVVEIPVEEAYGPNVTLAACYVRDKKFARSDIPLRVSLVRKTLTVTVTPDRDKYQPGESAAYRVRITDAAGRPAAGCPFSLGVVDESIYALAEDDPQEIVSKFYPRRWDNIETDYSFSVRYLGDTDKSEPNIQARRKFLDTAYWQPDLVTDADGRARVRVPFPDNLTTWRASVYACSDDTAIGYGKSKVVVTKPFFVRLDAPRFVTQGDHTRLLAIVHNDTGADQSVALRLRTTGLSLGDGGCEAQTVSVKQGQDATVTWPLTAADAGDAPIRVTAWTTAGGTQYTDGIERTLTVKPWGRQQFTALAGDLDSVRPEFTHAFAIEPGAVPNASRLVVRVTPSVGAAMVGGLDYLVGYPYGCTEQTLSRFLPDVLVQRIQRQSGRPLFTSGGGRTDAALTAMVRNGLTRLRSFQHEPSGGWGWWEHDDDDPFMTAYVLYGLSEAKAAGYPVSDDMLKKGAKAGADLVKKAPIADKPFLLYALALAGDAQTPRQVAPKIDLRYVAPDGLAYLVLMEKALGADPRTGKVYAELQRRLHEDGSLLYWKNPEARWNGSDRMATALGLRAMLAAGATDGRVTRILRWLMKSRTDGYWGSTRDTSWVLTAFCDYLRLRPADALPPSGQIVVTVNGRPVETIDVAAAAADAARSSDGYGYGAAQDTERIVRVPASALFPGANALTVRSTAGTTVFYTASLTQTVGAPDGGSLPPLAAPPQNEGLTITREYLRIVPPQRSKGAGAPFSLSTEDAGGRFAQGDNVRVRLTVNAPKDLEYVLIEDPFPSAFEPTARGTAEEEESSDTGWGWWYSNVDVRDDRIAVFARKLPKGTHIFEYSLRAQTPGTVRALPAQLQGMYAPDLRVETGDDRLEVKE